MSKRSRAALSLQVLRGRNCIFALCSRAKARECRFNSFKGPRDVQQQVRQVTTSEGEVGLLDLIFPVEIPAGVKLVAAAQVARIANG